MKPSLVYPTADLLGPAKAGEFGAIVGLEPIKNRQRWPVIARAALTALMVAGLARELLGERVGPFSHNIPTSPLLYIALAMVYMSTPSFDWLIFRKLWSIPAGGFGALLKKQIASDVILSYSGEAYFYAWARERMKMASAPFVTVKDVSILSAIAGNVLTLVMLGISLPLMVDLLAPGQFRIVAGSAGIIFAMSLPLLVFSKRIFSLPKRSLWWVFGMHCLRLTVGSTLIVLAWHFAMPGVSFAMWLLLAATRLLASRLPLMPNKDLLFANFAILLIGQGQALSELVAFTSALMLLAHVAILGVLGLSAIPWLRR